MSGPIILFSLLIFLIYKHYIKKDTDNIFPLNYRLFFNTLGFVLIVFAVGYPAFFVEKGYFSAKLSSNIDMLKLDNLDLEIQLQSIKNQPERIDTSDKKNEVNLIKKHSLNKQTILNMETRLKSLVEEKHPSNMYFVMRALALGALGALLSLIAKTASTRNVEVFLIQIGFGQRQ